jgi:uncharacterized membrane-anchored protein YjiN (DUF445 family)
MSEKRDRPPLSIVERIAQTKSKKELNKLLENGEYIDLINSKDEADREKFLQITEAYDERIAEFNVEDPNIHPINRSYERSRLAFYKKRRTDKTEDAARLAELKEKIVRDTHNQKLENPWADLGSIVPKDTAGASSTSLKDRFMRWWRGK